MPPAPLGWYFYGCYMLPWFRRVFSLGCLKGVLVLSELKSFRSVFDLFLVCFKGEARVPESGVSYWYERSAFQLVTV